MYGRTFLGIERTTFVIDEQGVITHIFPKVKVDGHVEEVLAVLATGHTSAGGPARRGKSGGSAGCATPSIPG